MPGHRPRVGNRSGISPPNAATPAAARRFTSPYVLYEDGEGNMDFASAVKNDAFAPILTYVVPGAVATAPYFLVAASYFDPVVQFGSAHPAAFTLAVTVIVLLAGALLEEFGQRLELLWDRFIETPNWVPYLKLRLKDEIIAQRYLRRVVVRMKFELSMVFAVPLLATGLAWLNSLHSLWSAYAFGWTAVVLIGLFIYLSWESWESAGLLHRTRQIIIDAVEAESRNGTPAK